MEDDLKARRVMIAGAMRRHLGLAIGAGVVLTVSLCACKHEGDDASTDAGAVGGMRVPDSAVSIADSVDAGDALASPPPPLAQRTAEVPALNQKLLADPLYARLWTPAGKGDLDLILTAVSETIATVGADGHGGMPPAVMKALEREGLKEFFFAATATPLRTGALTPDFAQRIAGYLQSVRNAPNLGVSAPAKGVQPGVAFAGLAWWLYPNDPFYGREYLRSRKVGPYHWPATKSPWVSWLASEAGALGKLSSITTLTDAEVDRYNKLLGAALPPGASGDPEPTTGGGGGGDVAGGGSNLGTLLSDYSTNELRADERWKGRAVTLAGTAGEIQRSSLGGITIELGTGRAFEVPKVLCFVDDNGADAVKSISKGERITVQGTVDGLMMDVVVRHCVVGR